LLQNCPDFITNYKIINKNNQIEQQHKNKHKPIQTSRRLYFSLSATAIFWIPANRGGYECFLNQHQFVNGKKQHYLILFVVIQTKSATF